MLSSLVLHSAYDTHARLYILSSLLHLFIIRLLYQTASPVRQEFYLLCSLRMCCSPKSVLGRQEGLSISSGSSNDQETYSSR